MSRGKMLRQDTAVRLENELAGLVWEMIVQEDDLPKLEQYGSVCGVANTAQGVLVRLLSQEEPPVPCKPVQATLEDVYLCYFGGEDKTCVTN